MFFLGNVVVGRRWNSDCLNSWHREQSVRPLTPNWFRIYFCAVGAESGVRGLKRRKGTQARMFLCSAVPDGGWWSMTKKEDPLTICNAELCTKSSGTLHTAFSVWLRQRNQNAGDAIVVGMCRRGAKSWRGRSLGTALQSCDAPGKNLIGEAWPATGPMPQTEP